ncbi:peptidylprolyl isomerase [Paracoccus siganidrum]|uniref:peptidylprolyl isomerase n=1 Tax=Paracoccus siganidrum TaxID=1276757 RepID=UPI001F0C7146|nr:peptidylprolyl isomerase [Paracoccus siganidrum]
MKKLRTKGKSTIVWILTGLMVLGLGGFGVTSFSGGSTAIGHVGETRLTADDYSRGLRNQLQAMSQQAGQHIGMTQAQQMGIPNAILAQLVTAAALEEQARIIGISVGDERVVQSIADAPAFRAPSGRFDRAAYSEVLRRQGLTEAQFEAEVRVDEARLLLQRAVTGGVRTPQAMVDQTAKWLLETRDLSWRELTAEALPEPVADPDEATLEAWHKANADRFTAPEIRKLTYLWVTPEMLAPEVELDEEALRAVYDQNIAEYQQPERRMVSRLIMPSQEAAEQGRADIDAGEIPFEALVLQRGLEIDDVYLGEMTREQLGVAGDAVFALDQPGVVGPVQTNLGPALYQMNAILDPVDIPFEQARESLRQEAAIDRAARVIETRSDEFEEMLAAGETLEAVAETTPLELGQIEWTAEQEPQEGSIAGYETFRERAAAVGANDFPHIERLDDGGIFALRLDEIVPPTLKPFAEVREEVLADWRQAETHRMLLTMAEEERLQASVALPPEVPAEAAIAAQSVTGEPADPAAEDEWRQETGLTRDGWIENLPPEVLARAFAIPAPGEVEVADASDRVFLVRLDAVHDADLSQDTGQQVAESVGRRLDETLQADLFDYYNRAIQLRAGVQMNQSAINAVNTQVQ